MDDVKDTLNSKKLKNNLYENWGYNLVEGLVARGRSTEKGSSSNGCRSRSKSKFRKIQCFYNKKKEHLKMNSKLLKAKKKKERTHNTSDTTSVANDNFEVDNTDLSVVCYLSVN